MKIFKIFFICFVFAAGLVTAGHAYNLTMQTTSDGSTAKTVFAAGETITLLIGVDNGQGVAGTAFTLEYPSAVLDGPTTTSEGLANPASDIMTSFPFSFTQNTTTTQTHRENAGETGKIYFSGAAINTTTGLELYDTTDARDFFTVVFTVKTGATVGTGYEFTIKQTELWNLAAGYGNDTNGNGTQDSGETKTSVPVLVGVVDSTNLTSCEGLGGGCAYPVLLGGTSNPFSDVTSSFDVSALSAYEQWKVANGYDSPDIGGETDDYDNDGYTNEQERLNQLSGVNDPDGNAWDPTTQNAPGGTGYTGGTQRIPLRSGWNLVSFSVNKCFYIGSQPTVSMIDGIQFVQKNTIEDILNSIDGHYSYLIGIDVTGTKTYDPTATLFKGNMKYLAPGYGYYIKVKDTAPFDGDGLIYLEFEGTQLSDDAEIELNEGWNLIGYIGNSVRHVAGNVPTVPFPEGVNMISLPIGDDIEAAFSSINDQANYFIGIDESGTKTYDPTATLFKGNMKYVGSGYGYYVEIKVGATDKILRWDGN